MNKTPAIFPSIDSASLTAGVDDGLVIAFNGTVDERESILFHHGGNLIVGIHWKSALESPIFTMTPWAAWEVHLQRVVSIVIWNVLLAKHLLLKRLAKSPNDTLPGDALVSCFTIENGELNDDPYRSTPRAKVAYWTSESKALREAVGSATRKTK